MLPVNKTAIQLSENVNEENHRLGCFSYRSPDPVLDTESDIRVVLCVDNSGSMSSLSSSSSSSSLTKTDQVLNTITNMVPYLQDSKFDACNISLEIQSFDERLDVNLEMTKVTGLTADEKMSLVRETVRLKEEIKGRGGTDISLPLKKYFDDRFRENAESIKQQNQQLKAISEPLQQVLSDPTLTIEEKSRACDESSTQYQQLCKIPRIRRIFVLMTDGYPNAGDTNMNRLAERYMDSETIYYFVGYGKEHSPVVMSQLDKHRGHYLIVTQSEQAGHAVSDILTRIMYPFLENVEIVTDDPSVLFLEVITNTWQPTLQFGSLQVGKQLDLYFKIVGESSSQPICFTIRGTNPITKSIEEIKDYLSIDSCSVFDPIEEAYSVNRVKTLQLLSTVYKMNEENLTPTFGFTVGGVAAAGVIGGLNAGLAGRGVRTSALPATAATATVTASTATAPTLPEPAIERLTFSELRNDAHALIVSLTELQEAMKSSGKDNQEWTERKVEDLIAAIQIVVATMNGGERSLIYSTILLNEWFLHTLRISVVDASDNTTMKRQRIDDVADNTEDLFPPPPPSRLMMGRQFSADITPHFVDTCRSLSQGSGAEI
jgi:hypothetical protein